MRLLRTVAFIALSFILRPTSGSAAEAGNPDSGQRLYRSCVACHSVEPGRHMTGPSLANIWRRKAGTVMGFTRYSGALKMADIVWDARSLDAWLADPRAFIPGNLMRFRGIRDKGQRSDLIAYLRELSEQKGPRAGRPPARKREGMRGRGMRRQGRALDLKALESNNRITAIRLCRDTYTVETEKGEAHRFWEFNLRFKTDGSGNGPKPGQPVIIPAGMRGDRAYVVFASPAEISAYIKRTCRK